MFNYCVRFSLYYIDHWNNLVCHRNTNINNILKHLQQYKNKYNVHMNNFTMPF